MTALTAKKQKTQTRRAAKRPHWSVLLASVQPCSDALAWAGTQSSATTAWTTCDRGDWLLWLVATVMGGAPESAEQKRVVAAAVGCARLALPIYEARYPRDLRVRTCLDTTERWTKGTATIAQVREARSAAYAAADAAAAAYAAAYAGAYAAADAYAAAYAAAAHNAAAQAKVQKQCADIVRQHFTAREVARALAATSAKGSK